MAVMVCQCTVQDMEDTVEDSADMVVVMVDITVDMGETEEVIEDEATDIIGVSFFMFLLFFMFHFVLSFLSFSF